MEIYEIRDKDFEFYKKGEPTGHFVRGVAIGGDTHNIQLELLCNGHKLWFPKSMLIKVCDDNMDMGRGIDYLHLMKYNRRWIK